VEVNIDSLTTTKQPKSWGSSAVDSILRVCIAALYNKKIDKKSETSWCKFDSIVKIDSLYNKKNIQQENGQNRGTFLLLTRWYCWSVVLFVSYVMISGFEFV